MKIIISFIFLLTTLIVTGATENKHFGDTLLVGVYVDDIGKIDYINSSYEIVYYVWVQSRYQPYHLDQNIDVPGSLEMDFLYHDIDSIFDGGGWKYKTEAKIRTQVLHSFNVTSYPFDEHDIDFNFELTYHFNGDKVVILDRENSSIIPDFIQGWRIVSDSLIKDIHQWKSNYGDLRRSNQSLGFDSISVKYKLKRDSWQLFFKLFVVLFLSFFLATISLFLPNQKSEEKISLIVGALFTVVGNKYITDSYLPIQDSLNLSDVLHFVTIGFITFYAAFAIIEQRINKSDNIKSDWTLSLLSAALYFTFVFVLVSYF